MSQKNILGTDLETCSLDPLTGFFRDGCCNTDFSDYGSHTVCVQVTDKFLKFSKQKGNDLITPVPEYNFKGLKDGDSWCLCASRWLEAEKHGCAPKVKVLATNQKALELIDINLLKKYSIDLN